MPMRRLLPQKLNPESNIHLVYTSSPVYQADEKHFADTLRRLERLYPNTRVFEVIKKGLDPRYLAASENERLRAFRRAIRDANWLAPIYGGTGCADIVRYLRKDDLAAIRKNRPIVNGFSDTTFLLNYLHFKLKLITFLYANSSSLFRYTNYQEFFEVITGKKKELGYRRSSYQWLSPNAGPQKPIRGIAIGGNLETFRDLLDICQIQPRSWEDYILFMEDTGLDMEDLHRIIISLDQKGVFMHVKAVVVGSMNERSFKKSWLQLNRTHADARMVDHIFEYLISDVIEERVQDRDPLYILKVDNFGHKDERGRDIYNEMIIPIGARTVLHPNGTIEFKGPFVA